MPERVDFTVFAVAVHADDAADAPLLEDSSSFSGAGTLNG